MRFGRVRVKICGIRRVEDALIAAEAGADAIGVIQVEGTKRFISLKDAEKIFSAVPPLITKVVVVAFDRLSYAEMKRRLHEYEMIGADCIQLHGNERVEIVERLREETSLKIIKKISVPTASQHHYDISRTREEASSYERFVDAILLDTAVASGGMKMRAGIQQIQQHAGSSAAGGTGMTHNWNISAEIASSLRKPVILAGGLNHENVHHAILHVRPFAVDVSSGVENTSGWKDEYKVRKFVIAVHSSVQHIA